MPPDGFARCGSVGRCTAATKCLPCMARDHAVLHAESIVFQLDRKPRKASASIRDAPSAAGVSRASSWARAAEAPELGGARRYHHQTYSLALLSLCVGQTPDWLRRYATAHLMGGYGFVTTLPAQTIRGIPQCPQRSGS